jgi:hypothetical protein
LSGLNGEECLAYQVPSKQVKQNESSKSHTTTPHL